MEMEEDAVMLDVYYTDEVESIVLQRMSAVSRHQSKELWTKPVPELKYLNQENVARYRLIMRYFYENHSKLKYWLKTEEVFQGVANWGILQDYTEEQCQRDLETLTEWRNLTSRHDGGRAGSIEEYLRKRFRYQMTPYSIEIERLLESLEQIQGYGGSLEPALLERISGYITQIRNAEGRFGDGEALQLWKDVQTAFRQLHENASDYLASLQTAKAEELMLTNQFLVFKDTLSQYLRDFIMGLQRYGTQIEGVLQSEEVSVWEGFLTTVVSDEERMPMLDNPLSAEELLMRRHEEWAALLEWFCGNKTEHSDVYYLERETKDTIAKVVRYALAIQDKHRVGVSRRKELAYLGEWFLSLDNPDEAHKLGAYAFGLYATRHFQGDEEGTSDSPDLSLWDEAPVLRTLKSRSRIQRRQGSTEAIRSTKSKQMDARKAILRKKQHEAQLAAVWRDKRRFRLSELPALTPLQRNLLLEWISLCLVNHSKSARTPDGLQIKLVLPDDTTRTQLQFTDGTMDIPDFELIVTEAVVQS